MCRHHRSPALLDAGASATAQDNAGRTPLHLLCEAVSTYGLWRTRSLDAAKYVLARSPAPLLSDNNERTPIDVLLMPQPMPASPPFRDEQGRAADVAALHALLLQHAATDAGGSSSYSRRS